MKRKGYPRKRKSGWPGETGYDYYIVKYGSNLIGIAEDTSGNGLKGFAEEKFPHAYKSGRSADKDAIILAKKYGYKYEPIAEHDRKEKLSEKQHKEMFAKMTPFEKRQYRIEEMMD